MNKWVWYVAILSSMLYVACSFGDDVSGSSMETENSIAFEVLLANGRPAARTDVVIRPSDFLAKSTVTAQTNLKQGIWNGKTNEDGSIIIKNLPDGKYVIETKNDSLKGVLNFDLGSSAQEDTLSIQMEEPGTIMGSVVLPSQYSYARVSVVGLDYFVLTDSLGAFVLESLPSGTFSIVAIMESDTGSITPFTSAQVSVVSGDSMNINLGINGKMDSVTVIDTLFLESFEDSTHGWYTSVALYATATLNTQSDVEDREGLVSYFSYTNDSTNGWALMGHAFDSVNDFSNLDSVSFYARGDGRVSLAFDHWDDEDSTFTDKAWVHMEITSTWTRYVVKPSDFLEADSIGGNTGWDAVKNQVTNITFFGNLGTNFWLDDVVLYSTKQVLE